MSALDRDLPPSAGSWSTGYPGGNLGPPSGQPPERAMPQPYPQGYPQPYPQPYPHPYEQPAPVPYPPPYHSPYVNPYLAVGHGPGALGGARPPQRPAVIAVAMSLTVTGSLLWMVLIAWIWLLAASVHASFSTENDYEAVFYHVAERFELRMGQGLALPLFGLPVLATVAAFLLLIRRQWPRIAFSALGAVAIGWSFWWAHQHIGWWVPSACYIALAVGIVWSAGVGRWIAAAQQNEAAAR